jgi:hypothetical protein
MKTTRSELKKILKECLKELIAEGILTEAIGNNQQASGNFVDIPQSENSAFLSEAIKNSRMIANLATRGDSQQTKILEGVLFDSVMNSEIGQEGVSIAQNKNMNSGAKGRWAALAFNTQPKTGITM